MPYIARAVASFGVPALYVTHSATEISHLADRVLTVAEGRLTGWLPPAPRLLGQVINAAPGQIELEFGGLRLWLAGQGEPGEVWALPLGQDYLLSTEPAGLSNAVLVLEGRVLDSEPGRRWIGIEIAGEQVDLAWHRGDGAVPPNGTRIWLSLPRLQARPVQMAPDSD
jgi:hypothetical protein